MIITMFRSGPQWRGIWYIDRWIDRHYFELDAIAATAREYETDIEPARTSIADLLESPNPPRPQVLET